MVIERFVLLCTLAQSAALFEVRVPAARVLAVRGRPAVLGCTFTPSTDPAQDGLVVTWQRSEDSRVVHSFYYGQDQLDRQSSDYQNRTALYVSELQGGNASLRITEVRLQDVGRYLCTVSNARGTDKAQLQLEYGAFYSEPRLSINVSPSSVSLQYESEGYPEAEVRWLGPQGKDLPPHTEHTELTPWADGTGLFFLQTRYVALDPDPNLNLTFTLTNRLLGQVLQRPVTFSNGGYCAVGGKDRAIIISTVFALLFLAAVALFLCYHCRGEILNSYNY